MNRALYLRKWIRALTIHERKLLGPIARERNRFIKAASAQYDAHHTIPNHLRQTHTSAVQGLLMQHYQTVMPYFGQFVTKPLKARRGRLETKALPRHVFNSYMLEWAYSRSLENAKSISDTDFDDVQGAITAGLEDGLGVEAIASSIRKITDLTPYRAATISRTETHAAATYGAIEEARQTSQEIGIQLVKEWLPTLDNRTRPEHAAMAGSEGVPLDQPFIVGGEALDRPGDPAGSAENVINCRCALSLVEASS
jgi:uncharacterized protein with gpF-like domain